MTMNTPEKKKRGRPAKKAAPETAAPKAPVAPEEPAKRPVQVEIPGTERPRIKAIDDAAEEYVNVRDKRMEWTKKEVAAKQQLTDLMHKHAEKIGRDAEGGLTYRYDDMAVILKPTEETLKVKHVDAEEEVSVGKAPKDKTEGEV